MEALLTKIRTIISENSGLLSQMEEVSAEIQTALIDRSSVDLFDLCAKQQTLLARLEIVKMTTENLSSRLRRELGLAATHPRPNLLQMLEQTDAKLEIQQIKELKIQTTELKENYAENEVLLSKQYSSLAAYQQLNDMVSGRPISYDQTGTTSNGTQNIRRVEHQG
jgi:hypothetical protein